MDATELNKMNSIKWWQCVPLGEGIITPGHINVSGLNIEEFRQFNRLCYEDKTCLDLGTWDGYYAFEMERLGAKRVVAMDDPDLRWGGMDGFNFLHKYFNSQVVFRKGNIYNMPNEVFDIILCYGIHYHVNDPYTLLTNCFQVCGEFIIIEGLFFEDSRLLLELLPAGTVRNDVTNFYRMSFAYAIQVALDNGFQLISKVMGNWASMENRGSMLFQRISDGKMPLYPKTVFSLPPRCL